VERGFDWYVAEETAKQKGLGIRIEIARLYWLTDRKRLIEVGPLALLPLDFRVGIRLDRIDSSTNRLILYQIKK